MIAFSSSTISDFDPWVIHSGANDHMTFFKKNFILWSWKKFFPACLINRMPLRVLELRSFYKEHRQYVGKLGPRALKCVFTGYFAAWKGYKCYHPSSRKIFVSMDVTFCENERKVNKSADMLLVSPTLFNPRP